MSFAGFKYFTKYNHEMHLKYKYYAMPLINQHIRQTHAASAPLRLPRRSTSLLPLVPTHLSPIARYHWKSSNIRHTHPIFGLKPLKYAIVISVSKL